VALITGATGAVGAATPQIATVWRESKQSKRDRQEREVNAKQQAYVELLGSAADLRTRVANTAMYYGEEMPVRLTQIRESAADVQVKAAKVAFLTPELAGSAQALGSAATALAGTAIGNTDMTANVMRSPSYTAFDTAVDTFKASALAGTDKALDTADD
jgi:hypothetical protein